MSRLNMSYMVPQPIEPLNLEEVKFWLRIMQEHAIFIKAGLPCECVDLIDETQVFCQEFEALRMRADKVTNDRKFAELANDACITVKEFYNFKRQLLDMMLHCKLGGHNFPLFLDHVSREAEYFLGLLDKIKDGKIPLVARCKAQENVFWLRLMADHSKFIAHLLDPSERMLIEVAQSYSKEFDNLFLQGRDFATMLNRDEVCSFRRFIKDVRAATLRLRDYKKAAHDLIESCCLVGVIPEELADHVRREADHFLLILAMMEKGIMKTMPMEESCDICLEDECEPDIMDEPVSAPDYCATDMGVDADICNDICEEDEEEEREEEEEEPPMIPVKPEYKVKDYKYKKYMMKTPPSMAQEEMIAGDTGMGMVEEESCMDAEPPKPLKDPKYKWGAKWPRRLGK